MIDKFARAILPKSVKQYLKRKVEGREQRNFQMRVEGFENVSSPFSSTVNQENPLVELGNRYRPTKRFHNYLPYYWMHFRDIQYSVLNVLEIGVETDSSLRMWEDFFPAATLYGIDINPDCKKFESNKRKIFIGDQGDPDFLQQVLRECGQRFDIIIDDGSHTSDHQILCFEYLFPALTDHGIYVIEDVGVGENNLHTHNSMKRMIDHINYWPPGMESRDWSKMNSFPESASWLDKHTVGIAFYRYIIFILKGRNPEDNPYLHA